MRWDTLQSVGLPGARAIETTQADERSGSPPALADLHTHIIPAVDDGAPDLRSALETLGNLNRDGVTAIAATPHLNASNLMGKRRSRADEAWPELSSTVQEQLPGLELYRGYEIQLDTPDIDLSDPDLRLAGSRFALVEFFAFTVPTRSADVLAQIVASGYVPIIAHPERYWGYDRSLSVVSEWKDVGALVQLNSGSLVGEYGDNVRLVANRFLTAGWVDVIASDNHARPNRSPSLRSAWEYLDGRGLRDLAGLLLSTNPRRILRDEMPLNMGRVAFKEPLLSRLVRALRGSR